MNNYDLLFIALCIILVLIMGCYAWRLEVYKSNIEKICMEKFCYCPEGKTWNKQP